MRPLQTHVKRLCLAGLQLVGQADSCETSTLTAFLLKMSFKYQNRTKLCINDVYCSDIH